MGEITGAESELLRKFFAHTDELLKAGIVRSDKILGDIGEWICVRRYGMTLATSGRNPGYDGTVNGKKVQVKVHNSPTRTNLSVGNPEKYDELIVILGPQSRLRKELHKEQTFHIFRFSASHVTENMERGSGYYCAKKILHLYESEEVSFAGVTTSSTSS